MCVAGGGRGGQTEITVPSHISRWSEIQSSTVWHFSTDRSPAPPGVAHPYYLLPGTELNINHTSLMKLRTVAPFSLLTLTEMLLFLILMRSVHGYKSTN